MDRPALQRLFADIETGGIDCVVVYKVDRMSRALLDFARIIDLFGKFKVSFVSVTQQFNTTNSMGRLTLNILLSFAQFEYEGEHKAIVDTALWQKVRDILRRNGATSGKDVRNKHGALLKGLLFCSCCGTSMGHTYTSRKPKIYRYYPKFMVS